MPTIQAFDELLKDVVGGKRLSQSKVKELTDLSMSLMQSDTQLVSSLVRSHKEAQGPHKIQSLYVVDSLARSARRYSNKRALASDSNVGNAATFLVKLETFLEDIFRDLASSSAPESKEKAKKILDIWRKDQTFPAPVLTRLMSVAQGTEAAEVPRDTHTSSTTTLHVAPAAGTPAVDVQATLLSLINQAKATGTLSPPTGQSDSTPPPAAHPQLDPAQLELFRQLANVTARATPPPQPTQTPAQAHTVDPRQRPKDPRLHTAASDAASASADPRRLNGHVDSRSSRGEERHAPRARDGRSQSPEPRSRQEANMNRHVARRDVPLPTGPRAQRLAVAPSQPAGPQPVEQDVHSETPPTQPPVSTTQTHASATDAQKTPETSASLDTFDWAAFDATVPESWEALARAWQVSNGSSPTPEELMFLLNCMMGVLPPVAGPWGPGMLDMYGSGWSEDERGQTLGVQASDTQGEQLRQGVSRAQGYTSQGPSQRAQYTDAVTLEPTAGDVYVSPTASVGSASGTGKMEKVGDTWTFVRSAA